MTQIALFEDNSDKAEFAIRAIKKSHHKLWRHLANFPQALNAIADLDPDVGAAIVDGNLGAMHGTGEGEEIIRMIIMKSPSVVTIGNSQSRAVPGAQFQAEGNPFKLLTILKQLPK